MPYQPAPKGSDLARAPLRTNVAGAGLDRHEFRWHARSDSPYRRRVDALPPATGVYTREAGKTNKE